MLVIIPFAWAHICSSGGWYFVTIITFRQLPTKKQVIPDTVRYSRSYAPHPQYFFTSGKFQEAKIVCQIPPNDL